MVSVSCTKETVVVSPQVLQASSANLSRTAARHFIGERFGGGIIFYLDLAGRHGLIVTPSDFEEPAVWSRKDTLNGAKDTALGAGVANTRKIVKVQGFPLFEVDGYAALECTGLNLNGYQDWYLPSLGELNIMYQNKTIVGGFMQFSYWSSSEANSTEAWLKNFNSGVAVLQPKSASYAFRPIRKF